MWGVPFKTGLRTWLSLYSKNFTARGSQIDELACYALKQLRILALSVHGDLLTFDVLTDILCSLAFRRYLL